MLETALFVLFCYAVIVAVIFFVQRNFVYFPLRAMPLPAEFGVPDMEVITVHTEDELSLHGWYRQPASAEMPVIVYFHGNGGHIGIRGPRARFYIDHGYGVLLAEYRGYGGNEGKPSEKGIYKDARAYMRWLTEEQGLPQDRLVLYGESLGTGVVTQMALEYPGIKAMVLESPFTSLADIGQRQFFFLPVRLMMRDKFESIEKISKIQAPVLIVHGKLDMIVPFAYGLRVFEKANEPKAMRALPLAGHNDLYLHGAGRYIVKFLEQYQ